MIAALQNAAGNRAVSRLIPRLADGDRTVRRDFDPPQATALTDLENFLDAHSVGAPGVLDALRRLLAIESRASPTELTRLDDLKARAKQAFALHAQPAFAALARRLPYLDDAIVGNIFELAVEPVEGSLFYASFFDDLLRLGNSISESNWERFKGTKPWQNPRKNNREEFGVGLIDQFKKLASAHKGVNSVKAYKGSASEIVAAFHAAAGPGATVRVPMNDKDIAPDLATTPNLGSRVRPTPMMTTQDIDRTERIGNDKFYVEVKADAKTAAKSHGWNIDKTPQLKRYQEVMATRNQVNPKDDLRRHIAVEITDPTGWAELFLGGTLGLYAQQGFWLFIDSQRFSPSRLNSIWFHVKPVRNAIDKDRFFPPAAFAGNALPDLSPCFVDHVDVAPPDWYRFISGQQAKEAIDDGVYIRVGQLWIDPKKLAYIVRTVEPHLAQIDPMKFPEPEDFMSRTAPDLTRSYL